MSQFDQTAPPLREDFVKLSALGSATRSVAGTNQIRIYEASGSFALGINGAKPVNFSKGKQIKIPAGMRVDEIEFVDTSGVENTIRYYYGLCEVEDDTLQVAETVEFRFERPGGINAATIVVGATFADLADADAGTDYVLIFNESATVLEVYNAVNDKICEIAAGADREFRTTGKLRGKVPAGSGQVTTTRFFF